jgi:hypothetical protein
MEWMKKYIEHLNKFLKLITLKSNFPKDNKTKCYS